MNNQSIFSYSLLAFCLSFIGLPIYIYLPNYYADNFGLSLKSIALILLLTRLVDTIQDPLFGVMSDRFAHLKKKIILYCSPFLGVSFLFLFYPLNTSYIELWLTLSLIVTYSLFSIIYINYQSHAVSLSDNYHLKTKIIAYREVSFILGVIFAAVIPTLLFNSMGEVEAFFLIGVFYSVLISIFAIIFYYYAPLNQTQSAVYKISIKPILKNRLFQDYFIVFFLNSMSSAIPAVLILFFVEEVLNAKSLVGIFLVLYFAGLLFGVLLWTRLSKILNDKVRTFAISIVFTLVVFVWCYFLGPGDLVLYGVICILAGIGFGGDLSLAYSILTDIIQKYHWQKNESALFGISNFILKISLTLSSAILIYVIGMLENNAYGKGAFISFSYSLIPVLFRCGAAYVLIKRLKGKL